MERRTININQAWTFIGPHGGSAPVDLPHTWNATDGQDGGNDYWRGTCVYQKTFPRPGFGPEERVYLEFQGVNASARVVLNGTEIGAHDGGGRVQPDFKPEEIVLPQELGEVRETVLAVVEKPEPVAAETLAGTVYTRTVVEEKQITYDDAKELMEHFQKKDYITRDGKMKDTMKNAMKAGTMELPRKYEAARSRFETVIASADRKPPVRDASRDVTVRLNKRVMLSPEFMELWGKIKQKTTYRVHIDTERLVKNCVKALRDMPRITKTRLISQTADVHVEQVRIYHTEREMRTLDVEDSYQILPDLITVISDDALLTPATVNRILQESRRCGEFLANPEAFLEKAVEIIRDNRHALAIDGISYIKLDGEEYYAQEIFDSTELLANLDRNAVKVEHSVYDYILSIFDARCSLV